MGRGHDFTTGKSSLRLRDYFRLIQRGSEWESDEPECAFSAAREFSDTPAVPESVSSAARGAPAVPKSVSRAIRGAPAVPESVSSAV